MADKPRFVPVESVITGWDFSTGAVKCLAFDLSGQVLAEVRLPTDLWKGEPYDERISELNLMQLEGQARASVRAIVAALREIGRLKDWIAGGISATHHTAGRIDKNRVQVRRAICWNDQTLADYRRKGETRLGGPGRVRELIGGPWADRYSLSHLVKDEDPSFLSPEAWRRTWRILPHGPLAAGFLTGNFDVISVSSAASTGIMDLRTCQWRREMLEALESPEYRELAWRQLPRIIDMYEPIGRLAAHVCAEVGLVAEQSPWIFPTSDDQQAGLVGGGAVDAGQVAVILGNSAVVNSSSNELPKTDELDVMRLNWGPFLWMRCYNNGAQFLDWVVGENPDWAKLQAEARQLPPGCDGVQVMPFIMPEPSLGIRGNVQPVWYPERPAAPGAQFRAALEAIAYLIKLGVEAHERAGQRIAQITVSGGIARSDLMCEILATVLNRRLERLVSAEGPALGAAVTALAGVETLLRRQHGVCEPFRVADAVATMVRYAAPVEPRADWVSAYQGEMEKFRRRLEEYRASLAEA